MRIHVYAIRNTYQQQQQQKFPACKWNEGSVVALLQQGERGGLRFRESQSSRGSKVTLDQQPLRPALLRYECLLCAWRRGLKSSLYEAENGERKKKKTSGWRKRRRRGSSLKGAALVRALRFLIGWSVLNLTCSLSTAPNLPHISASTYYCSRWSVIFYTIFGSHFGFGLENHVGKSPNVLIKDSLVQILNRPIKQQQPFL